MITMSRALAATSAAAVAAAGIYYYLYLRKSSTEEPEQLVEAPRPEVAQRTKAVRFNAALSNMEVSAILAAATKARDAGNSTLHRTLDGGEYRTTWLQGTPLANEAVVRKKLIGLMERADREEGWGLLSSSKNYHVRVVEFHEYECKRSNNGGVTTGAPDPKHYDAGSLVTLDLMLSPTSEFKGGAFATLEANGNLQRHEFERGDAVVFVAHKYHHVAPVTSGTRSVLVIELWSGPPRTCPHRCLNPTGKCDFTRDEVDSKNASAACELLPFVGDEDDNAAVETTMAITVALFGAAREAIGEPEVSIDVPLEARTSPELVGALTAAYPQLQKLLPRCALAVNGEYLTSPIALKQGDEVAVLPPMSGG